MPVSVAMIARDVPPAKGGIPTHVEGLFRNLPRFDVAVTLFEGKSDFGTLMLPARRKFLKEGYDLLHIHSPPYGALAREHPLVITVHSPVLEEGKYYTVGGKLKIPFAYLLEKKGIGAADALIAVSKTTKDDLLRWYRVDPGRISIVPSGVDCQNFNPDSKSSVGLPRLLICSRLEPRKNVLSALRAISELSKNTCEVVVVGDGSERRMLEAYSARLPNRVTFTGRVPDSELFAQFSTCNIFLSTSVSEGFGSSVLQGMASGCAVVASDIPAHHEMITHEKDGVLYSDQADLARWLGALPGDSDLTRRLGSNARQTALKYSWENVARMTAEVYRNVLSGR